jgi:type II secretory pathway component GspD/PulD (secretin)
MKKLILPILSACVAGFLVPASAQNGGQPPDDGGAPPGPPMQAPGDMPPQMPGGPPDSGDAGQTAPAQRSGSLPSGAIHFVQPNSAQASSQNQAQSPATIQTPTAFMPPDDAGGASHPDQLLLNFKDAPLDEILNYLSDAAGFIIVMDTQVHGNVSVISSHPMTRDEAVNLLNSVLNQNGYAAIRNGRTLTIMDKSAAKSGDIPVQVGNNPDSIPRNDEIVTQIIPVRYVDASQLVSDLSSFVSPEATIVANQAGNSIVITDTQQNIHHIVEIISAIDQSAAGETEIQVFHLNYANPNDVASELGEIFPSGNPSSTGGSPIRFGGFPGGGFGGGGGGFFGRMMAAAAANNGGSSDNNRAQKQSQVTAVADSRTQSVIVMASKDLMFEIAGMMQSLDVSSTRDQGVYSYTLHNADPQEVAQVLQNMFQSSSSSGRGSGSQSSSQQPETSPLMNRESQNAQTVSTTSSTLSSGGGGSGSGRLGGGGGGGSLP